jgi:hypothetical protein
MVNPAAVLSLSKADQQALLNRCVCVWGCLQQTCWMTARVGCVGRTGACCCSEGTLAVAPLITHPLTRPAPSTHRSAAAIRKQRALARSGPAAEPNRNKTHWDHLLEEADWMAKEFQR